MDYLDTMIISIYSLMAFIIGWYIVKWAKRPSLKERFGYMNQEECRRQKVVQERESFPY